MRNAIRPARGRWFCLFAERLEASTRRSAWAKVPRAPRVELPNSVHLCSPARSHDHSSPPF
jgi:hypothetical protein